MDPLTIEPNHRILVVDDNRDIHEDIHKILSAPGEQSTDLGDDESLLFGLAPASVTRFQIDSAYQGQEGLEKVELALGSGRPYAMAFVDIRMPPGWDGVETITHLRRVDPNLQTVIFTAYSDYSWSAIQNRLGPSDSLLILKKPFDNIEVIQLAHALTSRWLASRQTEGRLADLDLMLARRNAELAFANQHDGVFAQSAQDALITKAAVHQVRFAGLPSATLGGHAAADPAKSQDAPAQLRRKGRDVFLVSLRVLSQIGDGLTPSRRDVIILRRNAAPGEEDIPVDQLCCRFIRRELDRHQTVTDLAVTESDVRQLKQLASQALSLLRVRERRHLTEVEYTYLHTVLRQKGPVDSAMIQPAPAGEWRLGGLAP